MRPIVLALFVAACASAYVSTTSTVSAQQADAGVSTNLASTCVRAADEEFSRRHVDFDMITSVRNVHVRLEVFGLVCATTFPTWAAAATRASKVGVAGRRQIFAQLLSSECPTLANLKTGADVVNSCPNFVGAKWSGASASFLGRVDAGTFAFATLLFKNGFGTFAEELALQASFHPELDP